MAVPPANVDLESQSLLIDRTASESGGRRGVREEMKTRVAERGSYDPGGFSGEFWNSPEKPQMPWS